MDQKDESVYSSLLEEITRQLGSKFDDDPRCKEMVEGIRLKESEIHTKYGLSHFLMAKTHDILGEDDKRTTELSKAMERYDTAIEIDRNNSEAFILRGNVKSVLDDRIGQQEDYQGAYELLSQQNVNDAEGYIKRAELYIMANKPDEGFTDFDSASELLSTAPEWYDLAQERKEHGDYQGALVDLEKALHKEKTNVIYLLEVAELKEKLGDFDGALEDCNIAVGLEPENSKGYAVRSKVYYAMGNNADGLKDLEYTTELIRKDTQALEKKNELASADLREALKEFGRPR